jgi:uncharacterized protein YndB with AHSA1/START domain
LAESGARLKALAERSEIMSEVKANGSFGVMEIELEYEIAAGPERVWAVMSKQTTRWWKRARFFMEKDATTFHLEMRAGGHAWEEGPEGSSLLWWTITAVRPGKSLQFENAPTRAMHEQVKIELVPRGKGTVVRLNQTLWGDLGEPGKTKQTFVQGWGQLIGEGLKAVAEEK